jgi:hypothetical protein
MITLKGVLFGIGLSVVGTIIYGMLLEGRRLHHRERQPDST